jgi:hypothetical protein
MRAFAAAILLVASLLGGRAHAHAMPNSTVVMSQTPRGFDAEVTIPLTELEAALGGPVGRDALEAYLRAHVAVTDAGGRRWPMGVMQQRTELGDHPSVHVLLRFPRPARAAPRGARLRYDAVNHRIASHYVLVYRRVAGALTPLGRLQTPDTVLTLP